MKVKSTATVSFPSLNWGIGAGEEKECPNEFVDEVLKQHVITKVDEAPQKATSAKGDN